MKGNLFIPKPCHENWNAMTPEDQGRHCAVCSKVVKDFTQMKTEEIVYALQNTEGEVCGRINVTELTPTNKMQELYFWVNRWMFSKAIYPIMALLGITFLNNKVQSQNHDYHVKGKVAMNNYHSNSKKITLVVKSSIGNAPIANADITIIDGIKNPIKNLSTDSNGRLSVTFSANDLISDLVEIEISAVGFELKRIKINLIKDIQTVEIKMQDEMMIMGEMIYMPE